MHFKALYINWCGLEPSRYYSKGLFQQLQSFAAGLLGEYTHYTKSLKRQRRSSFRKRPSSIHVFIGLDTCCSTASRHSDWEAVGTREETCTHRDTMGSTGKQLYTNRQTNARNRWERRGFPIIHTDYFLAIECSHTLLAGFSALLAAGSGCSCLPFLDGVLFILGEWNLSISFMVKEDRWDRCDSVHRRERETKWSGQWRRTDSWNLAKADGTSAQKCWYRISHATGWKEPLNVRVIPEFKKTGRHFVNVLFDTFSSALVVPAHKSAGQAQSWSLFQEFIMCTDVKAQKKMRKIALW